MIRAILAAIFSLSHIAVLLFWVPRLSHTWAEMETALPSITRQVVENSNQAREHTVFLGVPLMFYLCVIYLLGKRVRERGAVTLDVLSWIMVALPLIALLWSLFAVSVVK
ncbi:hypothetical protein P0Y35_12140 [Kiritimatiellaeota bacterium B1221]|nr:hypothetical protein [Kiritimatiellaeota bacterium B1221]